MERQQWKRIVQLIHEISKPYRLKRVKYSLTQILQVWFWAVLHDRPIHWATRSENWPCDLRRRSLPSDATMSRRLRSKEIQDVLKELESRLFCSARAENIVWFVDGKSLVIGGCSKDRQAGYGRAAGCKAKGYKLHLILGKQGEIGAWRVTPIQRDEKEMARRMLRAADLKGYVVGDKNYDSNPLHQTCDEAGDRQLIAPRRYGSHRGLGHQRHAWGRLRSRDLLESPMSEFGQQLLSSRDAIERYFGNLSSWGGGLTHLPPWVRTHRRVHRWVQAKLLIHRLKMCPN